MMNRGKALFMKTYGKQSRKINAWISPDNRKKAFDSTTNYSSDLSLYEPPKHTETRPKKYSVANRAGRHAKRKAMQCLKAESDEENLVSPPPPAPVQPTQQSNKLTRKSKHFSQGLRQKLNSSESEADSTSAPKRRKTMARKKKTPADSIPCVGRFVTRRRGAIASKPKLPKRRVATLDSSDDFVRMIPRQSRQRIPSVLKISSAENSFNDTGNSISTANPMLREISLNVSADHNLGPCPRKPLFCSTPSLHPFDKRRRLIPRKQQPSASQSVSVSHIGLSTSQEELDSPEEPFSPAHLPPPGELSGEKPASSPGKSVKEQGTHHCQELSDSVVLKQWSRTGKIPYGDEAESQNNSLEIQNGGLIPSLHQVSPDPKSLSETNEDSDGSCLFVSAATGSEWLVEALKDSCLTQRCTVQLERVDKLIFSLLDGQPTFSSCRDLSSLVYSQQNTNHLDSEESCYSLGLSETSNATNDQSQSVKSKPPLTYGEITDLSSAAEWIQPSDHMTKKESCEQMQSVVYIEVTHHEENGIECKADTQSLNSSCSIDQELSTSPDEEEGRAAVPAELKEACVSKKWTVQLKQMSLSQLIGPQELQNVTRCTGSGLASEANTVCPSKSEYPIVYKHRPTGTTCSQSPDNRQEAFSRRSAGTDSWIDGTRSSDLAKLKEECLAKKFTVEVKRMTLPLLVDALQHKGSTATSSSDVPGPASVGGHVVKSRHSTGVDLLAQARNKKRVINDPQDQSAHANEDLSRNPPEACPKRKKARLAPKEKKRRSVSKDRSGTSRKACVSGLSVSRWKDKGNTSTHVARSRPSTKVADCSVNELFSTRHRRPMMESLMHGTSVFSTPVRANLLADLSSNTHTWSRLKAALSVHRKTQAFLTPERPPPSMTGTPRWARQADTSLDLFATPIRTPLPECFWSQLRKSNLKAVCEDPDLSDAEKVYAECGQQGPLSWEECIIPQRLKRCVKIGEGTFGEVFSTINAVGDTVALKVIPVEGSEKVNGEDQKNFGEILHEIIISKELSSLKDKQHNQTYGFIGLNDLHCVRGCYPPALLKAWDAFDRQKGSENDRPDFFETDQLFLVLEFEFGGSDLENSNGTLASLVVAKSILHQVTAALAVAEEELRFEHRDLHWGNVLVKTTKQKTGSFHLNGTNHSLDTKGVLVRIIDYSLSRLEIDGLTVSCDISEDEELFMGQGDCQFDIYRLMRQENSNDWNAYQPYTNVLWLHYLCSKLLVMRYRGAGGKGAKGLRRELTCFVDNVLKYRSATEVLENCFSQMDM